jgi:type IV secretory pathway TrbL component
MPDQLPETVKATQSKKFWAFLISEITWKVLVVLVLFFISNAVAQMVIAFALIIIAGFVEAGYILGQASLDKYLKVAKIAVDGGHDLKLKGMEITAPKKSELEQKS